VAKKPPQSAAAEEMLDSAVLSFIMSMVVVAEVPGCAFSASAKPAIPPFHHSQKSCVHLFLLILDTS
jgi:hypothetical protein